MPEYFCPDCQSPITVQEGQGTPEKCGVCEADLPAPEPPAQTTPAGEVSAQTAAVHICRLCGASNPSDGRFCSVCREPFERPVPPREGLQLRRLPGALQLAAAIYRVNLGRIVPAVVILGALHLVAKSAFAYAALWASETPYGWLVTGHAWGYRGVYLLYTAVLVWLGLSASRVAWHCATGRGVTLGDIFQRSRGILLLVALCFVWREAGVYLLDEMRHQMAIQHSNQAAALLILNFAADVLFWVIVVLMSFAVCSADQKPIRTLASLVPLIRENWAALLVLCLFTRLLLSAPLITLSISPWSDLYRPALLGVAFASAIIAPYLWLLWCVAYLYAADRADEITLRNR